MDLLTKDRLFLGIFLFIASNIIAWYQLNSYKVFNIMEKNYIWFVIATAIPVTLGFFTPGKLPILQLKAGGVVE